MKYRKQMQCTGNILGFILGLMLTGCGQSSAPDPLAEGWTAAMKTYYGGLTPEMKITFDAMPPEDRKVWLAAIVTLEKLGSE